MGVGFRVQGLRVRGLRALLFGVYGFRVQGFAYSSTFQVPSSRIGTVQVSFPYVKSCPKQQN